MGQLGRGANGEFDGASLGQQSNTACSEMSPSRYTEPPDTWRCERALGVPDPIHLRRTRAYSARHIGAIGGPAQTTF